MLQKEEFQGLYSSLYLAISIKCRILSIDKACSHILESAFKVLKDNIERKRLLERLSWIGNIRMDLKKNSCKYKKNSIDSDQEVIVGLSSGL